METKTCASCASHFSCGDTNSQTCWCNEYPALFEVEENATCMCPSCFKLALLNRINAFVLHYKNDRSVLSKIKDLKPSTKLLMDVDYYIENSLYIFTAWYHLKRGHCCGNSCRHCPYS
jgi:hypothetical protein